MGLMAPVREVRFERRVGGMRFHLPSFLLGALSAVVADEVRDRFRPVVVESAAVASVIWMSCREVVERQRENIEDLWAEVQDRARDKLRRRRANGGFSAEDEAEVGA
jgi:hypothetical protein